MKNALKIGFLGFIAAFMIISCTDDLGTGGPGTGGPGTGGGTDGAPEIILVPGIDFISGDATVAPGDRFNVQLQAAKGATDLVSVLFDLDGQPFPNNAIDITIDGDTAPGSESFVFDFEKSSLLWNVSIPAHTDIATRVYSFIIKDEAGLTDRVDINITTDDGGTGGGDPVPPTINVLGNTDVSATAGGLVCFNMDVLAGNPALDRLAVFDVTNPDNPILIEDLNRLYFGGTDAASQFPTNPFTLLGDDKSGFNKPVYIRAQDDSSSKTYSIVLVDEAEVVYQTIVTIRTAPVGNPITERRGVLFNRAGPAGTGGLDLDTGEGTGSSDTAAELKDNGIDSGASAANNWLQTISGINGTVVKELISGAVGLENFSFDNVTVDSEIEAVWGAGQDFFNTNLEGEVSSDAVSVGDTFIALRDGKYYMFIVREVNVSMTDNSDNYVVDIKS